jgi:hypothetical protein
MYQALQPSGSAASTTYPSIQLGRDYFNEVAKPGYTPYTYPHPWTFMTNAVATNPVVNVPATTNTAPALSPPTGLSAHGL